MKNLINAVVCVMAALFFCTQTVHAAFPVHTVTESNKSVTTEKRSFEEFVNAAIEKYNLPVPPVREATGEDGGLLNILSLSLGAGGIIALVAMVVAPAAVWVLLAAAVGLGIAAIVTGAMGMKRRPLRGLGIAGFVMGIGTLSFLLVVALFALFLILLFGELGLL